MLEYEPHLKRYARDLRSKLTEAEQCLWQRLRRKQIHGVQFYRQKPIGHFIVDFYAPAIGLVIELDGGQHFEPDALKYDQRRDAYLRQQGLQVMRFDNMQVLKETDAVLGVIHNFAGETKSSQTQIPPSPPFAKGGATAATAEIDKTLGEWLGEADERAYREL